MRLAALSIIVPDYDEAIAHYCGDLGFVLMKDDDQGHKRWVEIAPSQGGTSIILARAETPAQKAAIGNQGAGRVWLFLQTENFEADRTRMEQAGIVFEEATRWEPYGKVAVFRDAYGNRWDLLQSA